MPSPGSCVSDAVQSNMADMRGALTSTRAFSNAEKYSSWQRGEQELRSEEKPRGTGPALRRAWSRF